MAEIENWVSTTTARALTGYSKVWLIKLAKRGTVRARRVLREWLFDGADLMAYRRRMDELGGERYDGVRKPAQSWREGGR